MGSMCILWFCSRPNTHCFQSTSRRVVRELLGVESFHDGTYCPLDNETFQDYVDGRHDGPKDDLQYRLYFGKTWHQAKWNQIVISNLASAVIEGTQVLQYNMSLRKVEAYVWSYVHQVQGSWKKYVPRRNETQAMADARAKASTDAEKQRKKIRTRKVAVSSQILFHWIRCLYYCTEKGIAHQVHSQPSQGKSSRQRKVEDGARHPHGARR